MSTHAATTDQIEAPRDAGDRGAASSFDIKDLGGIFKATIGQFASAQTTVDNFFGKPSEMLPFNDK